MHEVKIRDIMKQIFPQGTGGREIRQCSTDDPRVECQLQELWSKIYGCIDSPLSRDSKLALEEWGKSVLELMSIADEACQGIGFASSEPGFATFYFHNVKKAYLSLKLKEASSSTGQDPRASSKKSLDSTSKDHEETDDSDSGKWKFFPPWPPDLFAFTAYIVRRMELYTLALPGTARDVFFTKEYAKRVKERGKKWRETYREEEPNVLEDFERGEENTYTESPEDKIDRLTSSICTRVPPSIVCVQPKTLTPQVGCTLRSLSSNLALLPGWTEVRSNWFIHLGEEQKEQSEHLNLLLIPFPYEVCGKDFTARPSLEENRWGFFDIEQNWLPKEKEQIKRYLVEPLIESALKEIKSVHGIVFPELAMDEQTANVLVEALAKDTRIKQIGLEFIVIGVLSEANGTYRNQVYTHFFNSGFGTHQNKHHRWKLEESQIGRYKISHKLHPKRDWWENIDVSGRTIQFFVFRDSATMATLICEDLARIEPVQKILRSIGPNLVFALLMDGPQLQSRWAGRYATILAEDPGSSVLSFTSLGMIKRSHDLNGSSQRCVSLWKDPKSGVKEINIFPDKEGLLITLCISNGSCSTLDLRSNDRASKIISLTSVHQLSNKHHDKIKEWRGEKNEQV